MNRLTPVQPWPGGERFLHSSADPICWVKRDDLFEIVEGARGGKARSLAAYLDQQARGRVLRTDPPLSHVVTWGSREGTQAVVLAALCRHRGYALRVHVPWAKTTPPELHWLRVYGAEVVEQRPGYANVIEKRARDDAAAIAGALLVPDGPEIAQVVACTAPQVANLPEDARRVVVAVGSGMTLAGILHGIEQFNRLSHLRVLGVVVGADPQKRLDKYAPANWRDRTLLVPAPEPYRQHVHHAAAACRLDPQYEAKVVRYVKPYDVIWSTGCREAA